MPPIASEARPSQAELDARVIEGVAMAKSTRRGLGRIVSLALLLSAAACLVRSEPVDVHRAALLLPELFISEVAQDASYGGSSADKVEVFCSAANGCDAYKICDSAPSGTSCSALQPALAAGARAVVSRGTSITISDQVWLSDAGGNELSGTRVGPFACAAAQSQARNDCANASFGACAAPSLGAGSGSCAASGTSTFAYGIAFTSNQHGQPETTCTRPACLQLLAAIDEALTSIDFAVYGVRGQPAIISALVAAQARGVRVRGVVDTENADCTAFGYPDTPLLRQELGPSNVVCDTGAGFGYIMHDKFFVFDAARVWTGSTNISDTELGGEYNSDVAISIGSPELAAIYTAEFEEMFGGAFHKRKTDNTSHRLDDFADGTTIESYFSPSDHAIANAVIPLIESATLSLDVAMFYFTSADIEAALEAAAARGVRIRMVLDAGGASNKYSASPQLCAAGGTVKVENWGGKSHSKWAVADAALPAVATVLLGSMNWTAAGDQQNDENTLVIKNAALAGVFAHEFARQWADLAEVPSCSSVAAESAQSSSCGSPNDCSVTCSSGACCDGLDNDYDGRIDLQEEACACADGIDNDGDGYIDLDDYDCRPALADP
jgi:phosphatidylserine/phosphatidylglycerophosphate/cardiolipin synthase-like enzyme